MTWVAQPESKEARSCGTVPVDWVMDDLGAFLRGKDLLCEAGQGVVCLIWHMTCLLMPFWVSSLAAFCRFRVDASRLIAASQSARLSGPAFRISQGCQMAPGCACPSLQYMIKSPTSPTATIVWVLLVRPRKVLPALVLPG